MAPPIPVYLVEYDPAWPGMAMTYIEALRRFEPLLKKTHHIGSTSIPGIASKPVLDLMPVVSDIAAFDARRDEVEAMGYVWHGEFGVEGRRFCTLNDPVTDVRLVQFHAYQIGSPHARRQLSFRDYLRSHADIAKAYEKEKRRAMALFPDNSTKYAQEKGMFIRSVEAKALEWFVEEPGTI
jgi:GrpB-like predicted nucleotidyltransferase (UPF0157 family)